MRNVIIFLLTVNCLTFLIYGWDKRKAVKGQWRVPERTLILFAIIGGSIGALLGMQVFHHKTKKNLFRIGIPLILALQILVICLYMKGA